jgi:hypothetical protein
MAGLGGAAVMALAQALVATEGTVVTGDALLSSIWATAQAPALLRGQEARVVLVRV